MRGDTMLSDHGRPQSLDCDGSAHTLVWQFYVLASWAAAASEAVRLFEALRPGNEFGGEQSCSHPPFASADAIGAFMLKVRRNDFLRGHGSPGCSTELKWFDRWPPVILQAINFLCARNQIAAARELALIGATRAGRESGLQNQRCALAHR
jgi:hypothetical protein